VVHAAHPEEVGQLPVEPGPDVGPAAIPGLPDALQRPQRLLEPMQSARD